MKTDDYYRVVDDVFSWSDSVSVVVCEDGAGNVELSITALLEDRQKRYHFQFAHDDSETYIKEIIAETVYGI